MKIKIPKGTQVKAYSKYRYEMPREKTTVRDWIVDVPNSYKLTRRIVIWTERSSNWSYFTVSRTDCIELE